MNEDEQNFPIKCQRCGRCCRSAHGLFETEATIPDIACWIEAKRFDILPWVSPIMVPDSETVIFDIWISPRTHDYVNRCPWARKQRGSDLYGCTIYDVRPAACREWPSDMAKGLAIGCPACQALVPPEIGVVTEFPKKDPDESP
ncbi:MAG: YkgJ family cysteine cluster protein [Deltaproteobacteria bacterium]|nr:YkgJ family cysteine cluster protein [Deltaproteobacteria bacterium]